MNLHNIKKVETVESFLQAITDGYEDIRAKKAIRLQVIQNLQEKEHRSNHESFYLGLLLLNDGEGLERFESAKKIAEDLLDIDPARGNYLLGWLYSREEYPEASEEKTFAFMKSSMGSHFVPAINSLGYLYLLGKGIEKNKKDGVSLIQVAALEGRAIAQYNLAVCHQRGLGVKASMQDALRYYRLSAEQGEPKALTNLGSLYYRGDGVEASLPTALKLWEEAADWENPSACLFLGQCYLGGDGVEASSEMAIRYFNLGADLKNLDCLLNLADIYYNGKGVAKDLPKALELFKKSEKLGFVDAKKWIQKVSSEIGEGTK